MKRKNRRAGGAVSILLLLFFIVVFVVSGLKLLSILGEYEDGKDEYDKLNSYLQDASAEEGQEESKESQPQGAEALKQAAAVDHEALKEINPEYAGWISGRNISYPVVQGADNEWYLTHTFYGSANKAGCIFVDAQEEAGLDAPAVFIYGHNLKNDTMFAELMEYKNQEYYEENPAIWIYLPGETREYWIFSVVEVPSDSWVYSCPSGESQEEWDTYIDNLQSASLVETGILPGWGEQVILLSTCTNVGDGRLVVAAVKTPFISR